MYGTLNRISTLVDSCIVKWYQFTVRNAHRVDIFRFYIAFQLCFYLATNYLAGYMDSHLTESTTNNMRNSSINDSNNIFPQAPFLSVDFRQRDDSVKVRITVKQQDGNLVCYFGKLLF